MRLLNTNTLKLETFYGVVPPYAILSHTWGPDEPTFSDMEAERASKRAGFNKVLQSSSIAAKADLMYIWCDTICIDKSSSAELSEAINSMFRFYNQSAICYVYLEDVSLPSPTTQVDMRSFEASRWFTRGWTLQELIAPSSVSFFSSEWTYFGGKSSLSKPIQTVTKIDEAILKDPKLLRISV
jgi:hypothetical protein